MLVDDSPVNIEAAMKLGMKGVAISRYGEVPQTSLPMVTNLDELTAMPGSLVAGSRIPILLKVERLDVSARHEVVRFYY